MTRKRKSRSVKATSDGLERLQQAKAKLRAENDKQMTHEAIAQAARMSVKTIQRFLSGEKVDKEYALSIIRVLGLEADDILSKEEMLVAKSIDKIRDEGHSNPERANQLVEGLDTALEKFSQDEEISTDAMDWLKAQRKVLAQDAVEFVFRKYEFERSSTESLDESDMKQFAHDIRQHLKLIYHCLDVGTWELIDRAVQESVIPVRRERSLYVEALTFIQEEKVKKELPPAVAQSITYYLDYLIRIIPVRL